jgi:hypothetical protein
MTLRELLDQHGINLDQQLVRYEVTSQPRVPVDEPVPPGHPQRLWEAAVVDISVTLAPWHTPTRG